MDRGFSYVSLHFNREKPPTRNDAEDVRYPLGVGGDVAAGLPVVDANRAVLPAEDSAKAEVVKDLLLYVLLFQIRVVNNKWLAV